MSKRADKSFKSFDEYFEHSVIASLKHHYVAYDILKSQLLKASESQEV
jgi:hypothetical protein